MENETIYLDDASTGETSTQLTVSDYASIERKKWVMEQYLSGRKPFEIFGEYSQMYKLLRPSFEKDVTWMYQQLRVVGENDVDEIIERHTERYDYLYRLATEKGDYRSAIQSLQALEKLRGITKDKEVNRSKTTINNNLNLPKMTVDEMRKFLGKEK